MYVYPPSLRFASIDMRLAYYSTMDSTMESTIDSTKFSTAVRKRALSGRGVEYHATGKFSKAAGTRKKTAYAPAKAREEKRWRRKIRLIPLAFEISGGWGEAMCTLHAMHAWCIPDRVLGPYGFS